MKALTDNKKVVNRGSPPLKKSKVLVKAKSEVGKKEYICVDENSLAMRRAQELQANLSPEFPSLVKFMLHSHTTGGFWLGLPKKFCTSHLPNHNAAIVLVDENGKETETRYLVEKCGLSAGWRGFSVAHNLIAGDVVVFQLIEPFKMKVYIVRANVLADVAGAISLLNLSHFAQPIASEALLQQQSEDTKENVLRICDAVDQITMKQHQGDDEQREISTSDHCPESNLSSGNDIDNSPQTSSNGLRFAEAVVDFAQVEDFEGFNIVVNKIIIDSEIPEAHRLKYYELCCSRKAYLHESLLDGLNYKLIAGAITETVNIADAIRAAKLTTGRDLLEVWDATLKGIEQFGIQVGFLRDRISKLVRLSGDVVASKKKEKAVAEAEMIDLWGKMGRVREVIDNLDAEIQAYSSKERVEELFKDAANAAW